MTLLFRCRDCGGVFAQDESDTEFCPGCQYEKDKLNQREVKMREIKVKDKILGIVWKLENVAVQYHSGQTSWPEFKKSFLNQLLDLMQTLIDHEISKQKKEG